MMDEMPQALTDQIRAQILHDTTPVKPLMSSGVYAALFMLIVAFVATLFAATTGFKGFRAIPVAASAQILIALLLLAGWSAVMVARSMRPASGALYSWISAVIAIAVYELLTAHCFRDHSLASRFVHSGVICLALGAGCAVLAALPIWMLMRRGLVVNPVGAGAILGLFGGLAGLAGLTLHCPIFTFPHVAVWHAAVLVVSTGMGALAGRLRLL